MTVNRGTIRYCKETRYRGLDGVKAQTLDLRYFTTRNKGRQLTSLGLRDRERENHVVSIHCLLEPDRNYSLHGKRASP